VFMGSYTCVSEESCNQYRFSVTATVDEFYSSLSENSGTGLAGRAGFLHLQQLFTSNTHHLHY